MYNFPVFVPVPTESTADREKFDAAQQEIRSLQEAMADLQRQVHQQRVLMRALFGLLQERQGLTEADLLDHFRQASAERAAGAFKVCTRCGRRVNLRFERCMYCEEPHPAASAFELI
jgi:hypothetical protein